MPSSLFQSHWNPTPFKPAFSFPESCKPPVLCGAYGFSTEWKGEWRSEIFSFSFLLAAAPCCQKKGMGRRSPLWRDYSSSFLLVAAPHSQQNGRQGRSKIFSPSILLVAAPPLPPRPAEKKGREISFPGESYPLSAGWSLVQKAETWEGNSFSGDSPHFWLTFFFGQPCVVLINWKGTAGGSLKHLWGREHLFTM